ncbi:MAG: death-on-curing protein [Candidatus Magasanikbacteria bacterium RIFOXYC2_FULL_42_28]|uniref:Death-on-curing protein n=1 Tax=Candidatus Magasanikbacteria bacterium RIFOXYC2_FULL_42_28 TaxID=1798704 RepID=A0A1F6NVX2_9BACT|nr:MAG: death-on-curing protein [Candidatus Magasanikbacteria bacterium RIFOXYC2_FULL_42_28]
MKKKITNNQVIVYQAKTGAIELRGDFRKETLWANLDQIAHVFGRDKSVVSRHIHNIFAENELKRHSVVAFFATTATDGKIYQVEYFNLDLILSVGYRVNSKNATLFRQWATKTLREHITNGFTINRAQIKNNYTEFMKVVDNLKILLPAGKIIDNKEILELISAFSATWLSLDAYDKDKLISSGTTKRAIALTAEQLSQALQNFKIALIKKGEATELFGSERQTGNVAGIVGNVMQSFGGKMLYPTIEEKAANLLYFLVKNHPFTDGNKRSGAYAFVWFLKKAGLLNLSVVNPSTLTALTILVAESDPKNREKMTRLILQLLKK